MSAERQQSEIRLGTGTSFLVGSNEIAQPAETDQVYSVREDSRAARLVMVLLIGVIAWVAVGIAPAKFEDAVTLVMGLVFTAGVYAAIKGE